MLKSCCKRWTPFHHVIPTASYSTYHPDALKPTLTRRKVTLHTLNKLYQNKKKITVMTAHDYPSGSLVNNSGIDICLVGDSLAMVTLGYENTNEITFDEMLHHAKAVARGCKHSFIVGDMPFGTYESHPEQALKNAVRYVKEAKVEAVKMEGGIEVCEQVAKLVKSGIPVMGHIGLTPQRQAMLGGYRVQGKTLAQVKQMYQDAKALQEAGCFSIVLEAIPEKVGTFLTKQLQVPTIGIGAGPHCSGQVLVQMDAVGMFDRFLPKFCKVYAHVGTTIQQALVEYKRQVESGEFPNLEQHCYSMDSKEEEERCIEWMLDVESQKDV